MIALDLDKNTFCDSESLNFLKVAEPQQLTASNGKIYTIRPLWPNDFELAQQFLSGLSQRTNLMRYFIPVAQLPQEMVHEDILRLTRPNRAFQITLIMTAINEAGGEFIIGIAELARDKSLPPEKYEVGIVMDDRYQGQGLGLLLLNQLIAIARRRGVQKMQATMLAENWPVRKLLSKLNLPSKFSTSQGETFWEATLAI